MNNGWNNVMVGIILSPWLFRRTFGTSNKCLPADLRFLDQMDPLMNWRHGMQWNIR